MEGAAQQSDGVGPVGFGQTVGAQHAVGQFDGARHAGRGARHIGIEGKLGRGVATGVAKRVVTPGVGVGGERVASGATGDRGGDEVGLLCRRQDGHARTKVSQILDVRVQTRVLDAELPGQRRRCTPPPNSSAPAFPSRRHGRADRRHHLSAPHRCRHPGSAGAQHRAVGHARHRFHCRRTAGVGGVVAYLGQPLPACGHRGDARPNGRGRSFAIRRVRIAQWAVICRSRAGGSCSGRRCRCGRG